MEINYVQIVLWVLGIVCLCLGWFARQVWTAVDKLKEDLNDFKVDVGTDYVRYDRLQDALKPLLDAIHEVKRTLEGKADKTEGRQPPRR